MEGVAARWKVGIAYILPPKERAPLPVEAFEITLVDDVVLVAVVDALKMHHKTVAVVPESDLALPHHRVEVPVPDAVGFDSLDINVGYP